MTGLLYRSGYCCRLAILLFLVSLTGCHGGTGIGDLIILKGELGALQQTLTETMSIADGIAKADISQASDAVGKSIKQIDGLIDHASEATTYQREEAARQGFTAIALTQEKIANSGKEVFTGVNTTLSAAAAILDHLPFISIPDTIFAVTPYRMTKDARDTEVSIFGYFPSIAENPDAVEVTIDDKPVMVKRAAGRLLFNLPADLLKSQKATASVSVQLPKRHWYSHRPTPVFTTIHLLNPMPFSFEIAISIANPAAFATLDGHPRIDGTNGYLPVHYNSEDLFNMTVDGKERYVPSTATFVKVVPSVVGIGKACGGCPDPHFVQAFTSTTLDAQMWGPGCSMSWGCGGGGSHIEVAETPTFNVRVKDVPMELPDATKVLRSSARHVSKVDLPNTWANAIVTMRYDDNFDVRETFVVLKPSEPVKSAPMFDTRIENTNLLLISTR